jgi:hypothetical protein
VILEYITVRATNTSKTVATNSFITINGGIVELTRFTFEDFACNVGVILFNEGEMLLLDEISVANVTFSGNGRLIYRSGGSDGTGDINLINSNFSSITASTVNGSVIYTDKTLGSINIKNNTLNGSISSGNGGAFYLCNCLNITVNESVFIGCSGGSEGKGGAIYFGGETLFTLINSSFANCTALYGGVIFSISEVSGFRGIYGVNFTNNSVFSGGNGNDIADNSSVGGNVYGMQSVINSTSNSTSSGSVSNFYIIQDDLIFDCLLTLSGCGNDPTFVSTTGTDSELCGTSASPCSSLGQGLTNIVNSFDPEAEINVGYGDYTNVVLVVHSIMLTISTNSENRPTLSLISPPYSL